MVPKEVPVIKETERSVVSGWFALFALLIVFFASLAFLITGSVPVKIVSAVVMFIDFFLMVGFFFVNPNEARVLQLFGKYAGTTRQEGLRWANPLFSKRTVSLRVRNFETGKMKVNDIDGNPIEIGAVIVWRVFDTAQATFDVESFTNYVQIQAEAAIRTLAMHHPYDSHEEGVISLRGASEQVADLLRKEVDERIRAAGCEIVDARIAHLAYAPEIAQAMLQRQQAGAIIAARKLIVEGAVSMVEMALEQLSKRGIVELDSERKASMVSNLLVVLCGERSTQPVINAGTIY